MRKSLQKPLIVVFLMLVSAFSFQLPIPLPAKANGSSTVYHNGVATFEWDPALYSGWDYRIRVTVTEPDSVNRTNEPISVYLEFPAGFAREKNIHVKFYNGTWNLVPYQVWNTTGTPHLDSCTITFLSNISKGDTVHYYVYFTGGSAPTAPDSPIGYMEWDNDTEIITAAGYQARMNLEYGFLDNFIINDQDLIGSVYHQYSGPDVEAGIITDWRRDEIDGTEDKANLDNSLSIVGPVFTRLVINKTTDYPSGWPSADGADIDRVWTFYPNYFTLEVSYDRPYDSQATYVVYGRSYHNGTSGGPVYGATAVENYTRYSTEYVRSAYINGYESTSDTNMPQYDISGWQWFGVYKTDQYAYSCVATEDSDINAIYYSDRTSYYTRPPRYGAMGWAYRTYGMLPLGLEAKLFYFPHGPQSDYSDYEFAINDHARVNNPVTNTNGSIEYRIFNLLTVKAVDYDGNNISNLKVQLSNATPYERNETTDEGIAEFDDLESGVYNMNFWYTIDGTEYQVSANLTGLNFNPGYIRMSTSFANCSLRTLHTYLQDEDYGLPLYDYTLRLNSTTNGIDVNGTTDENGNYNFTLLTYQSDFYNISVYDPDDIEQTAEPTGVNLNSSALGVPPTLVLTLIPPLNVTTLSHEYSNSSIDYASTIQTGRLITPTYAEVYYGDNVTFSISFIDVTYDNNSIHDANQSLWELYLVDDLWDSGNAFYNSATGLYTIRLNTSDYQWNTEYTLKAHFEREGCLIPANKTIAIIIKSWDTEFTPVPYIDTMQVYYVDRVGLTVFLNYVDMLSTSPHFLTDTENFSASILGVGPLTTANSSFAPQANNSIKFDFNLSSLADLGSYVVMINANHTYYECKQLNITLNLLPVPTYIETWDSSPDFELTVDSIKMLRAAEGENLTVTFWVRSNGTAIFPAGNVTGETGTYILPWEDLQIGFSQTGSPGIYAFTLSTEGVNLTTPAEDYTIIILMSISQPYYESIQLSIPLQVIDEWSADLKLISIDPDPDEGTIPWGHSINITLEYSCNLEPRQNPIENANVNFTNWDSDYWKYEELGNGIYEIELNTSIKAPGTHIPVIFANKTFYENATIPIGETKAFSTSKLKTSISLLEWNASVSEGEDSPLKVRLMDTDNDDPILDATITYSVEGTTISGTLNPVGNAYEAIISTQDLEPGEYWIVLNVTLPGRTVEDTTYDVFDNPGGSVRFSLTIGTPFPLVLFLALFVIGITAVPAGYGTLRYYRWARLPSTVKKIVRTIRSISKNKQVKEETITTRESLMNRRTAEFFMSAGISLPEVELIPVGEKIEVVPEIAELREAVYSKFPRLTEREKEALVSELLGMETSERDQFIKTLVEARTEEKASTEEALTIEALKEEELDDTLEELIQKQIITREEKLILLEELRLLPPEERKEFLERLRKS